MGKIKIIVVPLTATLLLATSLLVQAQQPEKLPRIGFLGQSKNSHIDSPAVTAFRHKLREMGWLEGTNVIIEWRFAKGVEERVGDFIAEFIRRRVDLMVMTGGRPVRLAKQATQSIPIVMMEPNHPVESGLIASLAKPGGNVTGLTGVAHELDGKRLELIKESVPRLSNIAVLWQASRTQIKSRFEKIERAAKRMGVNVQFREVKNPEEIGNALYAIPTRPVTGVIAVHTQLINSNRQQIIETLAKRRVPAIFYDRRYVLAGGLLSYGPNHPAVYAQAAKYVDKILKGTNPADLPVERPTKFDFVVNLKTAHKMGIAIPPDIVRWADEVFQ